MHVDQAGNIRDGGISGIRRAQDGGFLTGNGLTRNGHKVISVRDVTHGHWLDQQGTFAADHDRGRRRTIAELKPGAELFLIRMRAIGTDSQRYDEARP